MPRAKARGAYSIVLWPDSFTLPAKARAELIAITRLEAEPTKAAAMVRDLERILGERIGVDRVVDERPRPAETAVGIRELARAARSFIRSLAQRSEGGTAHAIETGKELLHKLSDIHDAMYAELTLPTGTPPNAPLQPRVLENEVTEAVSRLIRPDIGVVDVPSLEQNVKTFCSHAESVARRLAQVESRGRRGLRSRAVIIGEISEIYRRYAHPRAVCNVRPEHEPVVHPERLVIDFVKVALDAATIEAPATFEERARLVPH